MKKYITFIFVILGLQIATAQTNPGFAPDNNNRTLAEIKAYFASGSAKSQVAGSEIIKNLNAELAKKGNSTQLVFANLGAVVNATTFEDASGYPEYNQNSGYTTSGSKYFTQVLTGDVCVFNFEGLKIPYARRICINPIKIGEIERIDNPIVINDKPIIKNEVTYTYKTNIVYENSGTVMTLPTASPVWFYARQGNCCGAPSVPVSMGGTPIAFGVNQYGTYGYPTNSYIPVTTYNGNTVSGKKNRGWVWIAVAAIVVSTVHVSVNYHN